jgi:hypothetical protein
VNTGPKRERADVLDTRVGSGDEEDPADARRLALLLRSLGG